MSWFNKSVSTFIDKVPSSIVAVFAKKYIAGETLGDAIRVTRKLNSTGIMSTIDVLGEDITSPEQAIYFKNMCLKVLEEIDRTSIDANLSLKPTQMGLKIDKELCFNNIHEIVKRAKSLGNFVRIDMEDSSCNKDTIEMYRKLREEFGSQYVGTVLQAYMRNTLANIDYLSDDKMNIRLCKGIYIEPRKIAYKDPAIVNDNYKYALETLLRKKAYVGIATHDEKLVWYAQKLIREMDLKREEYEFQMLLGVDEELRGIIVENGHRLRVYVPFGKDWLPYSIRRLKENPNIARSALEGYFKSK